jgi:hypothetical protein
MVDDSMECATEKEGSVKHFPRKERRGWGERRRGGVKIEN